MALEQIKLVAGPGVFVAGDDIDTDQIIPARFLLCVTFDALGGQLFYDARFNQDTESFPVLIPPAYGLRDVALETYTGEGPVSYWNAYVAVTQMGARGNFKDERLGLDIRHSPSRRRAFEP